MTHTPKLDLFGQRPPRMFQRRIPTTTVSRLGTKVLLLDRG